MDGFGLCDHRGPFKTRRLHPHRNPGLEIVYVTSGRPVWQTEGRAETVRAGWIFFSLPWEEHGSTSEHGEGWEIDFVNLLLDRGYRRRRQSFGFHSAFGVPRAEALEISRVLTGAKRRAHAATSEMAWLMPALVREVTRPGFAGELAARSLARAVIVELARCVRAARPPAERAAGARRRVREFLRGLPSRCGEPWTLEGMAAACRLGRTRFAELFREESGEPPMTALNRARVAEARRRLLASGDSITGVAFDCGFSSSQYFARVFRAYTGCSARQYRRGRRGRGN
ncbi:MAG: helix-turn-helix transcriptional regulator [Planctomycetota bacterium]|jgi:AraC family L-rhamnose operon regulatory protein RhaS